MTTAPTKPKCPRCKLTSGVRDDGYHGACYLLDENKRLRAALEEIAKGCGHARCHAYPWIRLAQKALAPQKGAMSPEA